MSMAGEFNLCDANHVIQLFEQATEANYQSTGRVGSIVELPKKGRLTLTGDVHDHKENFRKILKWPSWTPRPTTMCCCMNWFTAIT